MGSKAGGHNVEEDADDKEEHKFHCAKRCFTWSKNKKNKALVWHKVEKDTLEVPSVKKQLSTAPKLKSCLFQELLVWLFLRKQEFCVLELRKFGTSSVSPKVWNFALPPHIPKNLTHKMA